MRSEELRPVPPVPRAKGQLRDGVAYVRSRPDIVLVMAIIACAGTFGFNFQMTTALMATEVYDKGAGEYGLLGSILAVGSLVGALLAARRTSVEPASRRRRRNRLRGRHARRRTDADVRDVRTRPAARRADVDDVDDGGQLVRPDGCRPGDPRPRARALPRRVHGRHADRGAAARVDRRTRRSAVDADRRRRHHRPRQRADRRLHRPSSRRRADHATPGVDATASRTAGRSSPTDGGLLRS